MIIKKMSIYNLGVLCYGEYKTNLINYKTEEYEMVENREEKIEALKVAKDYCKRLENGMETLTKELRGERLPDTGEYLKTVVNGLNWIIEVYNATSDLVNENENVIDKDTVNEQTTKLNSALKQNDDALIADTLENGIVPFLEKLQSAIEQIEN